ncbi:sushi, von Willebrand factor type A, EGF and pentraxin domain-containing protein 1-like isoform X1 [Acropora muricata]|uniref:sushi, von Willebrand factor type A, EGF and pentraxin domain-containing protein 1-like isoform X1 n=2 Tax=Acropora muricata TaxID=159855 RepID=UPI0034E4CC68
MLLYAIILNVLLLQGVKAKEESALGICGRPIVPSRGPLILHGNSFLDGDEVQFSCVANYDLFGSQRSRCIGQKWNTRVPECKARCIFGGDPGNGFAVRNAFFKRMVKHGVQIVYRCNEQYTLIGSATQECNNGRWTNARPSCRGICRRPIVPLRGPLILHGNSFLDGDEVHFSCVANYDLFGSQRSRCVGQKWNNRKPECKARCIFGGDPDNGFAVRNAFFNRTVKHGVQIVYRCNEHYILIGSATQECNNGQWTNARPSCKGTCGRPIIPSRGPLILLGNSFLDGDEVQFSCVANYDLFGSQRSRCNGQKWNTSIPECKARCIFGGDPDNGFAVRNAFFKRMVKHGVQMVYRCFIHYTLIGSANQECNNGRWTTARPSCIGTCGRPIVPLRGPLILNGNSFLDGDEVKFSCAANYDLFGSQRSRCVGQKWNTGIPECKARCIFGGDPDNGFAVRNAFFNRMVKHGLQIVYRCNKHYALIGSATQECNNGQWTSTRPSCKASCRRPEPPRNRGMRGDNFNHNKKVVFYCDENYQLVGQSQITCKDGSWSDLFPKCIVINCGPLQRPNHGNIIEIVGTTFGNRIVFECTRKGYEIRGSKVRTCQSDGSWSGLPTTCELVKCDDPGTPVNGMRIVSKGLVYGGSLRFKCNRDYTLMKGMSEVIYCQANKRWTASVPHCLAPCRDPGVPRQGNRIGDDFRHDSKVIFTCPNNYLTEGVGEISCSNGTWSNRVPTCKAPCVKFSRPANGYMRGDFRHGNQVRFQCYGGYQRIGAASSTCNDGTWSNSAPICKAKSCGDPGSPENGKKKSLVFTFKSKVYFECNYGYKLVGDKYRQCQSNQNWSGQKPTCELIDCGQLQTPEKAKKVGETGTGLNDRVIFECKEKGYEIRGSETRSCLENGTWSGVATSCEIISCDDPGVPIHGRQVNVSNNYKYGSFIEFDCSENYTFSGDRKIVCGETKDWSAPLPRCFAPCSDPGVPGNGTRGGNRFLSEDSVSFECQKGFELKGDKTITCVDGVWKGTTPRCEVILCKDPGTPQNGRKQKGSRYIYDGVVKFKCDTNYTLSGEKKIRCQENKEWTGSIPKCQAPCSNPGQPKHGRFVGDNLKHDSILKIECNTGYVVKGSTAIRCTDGKWNIAMPTCSCGDGIPLGMGNGYIRDDAITSSSETQQNPAHLGRLGGNSYWCSHVERISHLEISLSKKQRITGAIVDVVDGQGIRGVVLRSKDAVLHMEKVRSLGKVHLTTEKKEDTDKVRIDIARNRNTNSPVCLRAEIYGCDVD